MIKIGSINATTDIDNLSPGIYDGIGWQLDGVDKAGFLISLARTSSYRFQIALLYSSNENKINYRCYNNGWTSWKEV